MFHQFWGLSIQCLESWNANSTPFSLKYLHMGTKWNIVSRTVIIKANTLLLYICTSHIYYIAQNYKNTTSYIHTSCIQHTHDNVNSDSFIIWLWLVLKQRFSKLIKVYWIIHRFIDGLHDIWSIKLKVQIMQLDLSQLLEDVVGKNANKCYKCYGDRGVPNWKLISSGEIDMVGGSR